MGCSDNCSPTISSPADTPFSFIIASMITTMIFDLDGTLVQTERLHESGLLPEGLIVDDPERVAAAVAAAILQGTI